MTDTTQHWRQSPVRQSTAKSRIARRCAIGLSLCLLLVGVAGGIASLLHRPPEPLFLGFYCTRSHLGVCGLDHPTTKEFKAFEGAGAGLFSRRIVSRGLRGFLDELMAQEGEATAGTIVAYISAHANTDANGRIVLFDGNNSTATMSLRTVLEHLRNCEASKKLLVLDIVWPVREIESGFFPAIASDLIDAELAQIPDPDRLVLRSSSPGQYSVNNLATGRTAFGEYFQRGLAGDADGFLQKGSDDGRVTVHELSAFVAAKVDHWAQKNRGVRQTPRLEGEAPDFDLTAYTMRDPSLAADVLEPRTYPKWLQEGWEHRDQLQRSQQLVDQPWLLRRLEAALLHAELRWRSGAEESLVESDWKVKMVAWNRTKSRFDAYLPRPRPHSLAMLQQQGQTIDPAVVKALEKMLSDYRTQSLAIEAAKQPALQDQLGAAFLDQMKQKTDEAIALAIFEVLRNDQAGAQATLRWLDGLLRTRQPRSMYVETNLVKRLAELSIDSAEWPAANVQAALRTAHLGEQITSNPSTFIYAGEVLQQAAQHRHNAEVLLLSPGYVADNHVYDLFSAAQESYAAASAASAAEDKAYACCHDGFRLLQAYVGYLGEHQDDAPWMAAAESVGELYEALRATPSPQVSTTQRVEQLSHKTTAASSDLANLRRPFTASHVEQLAKAASNDSAKAIQLQQIDAVLATPLLAADTRIALWQTRESLAMRLDQHTKNADLTPTSPAASAMHDEMPETVSSDLSAIRVRLERSRTLLRLAGWPEDDLKLIASTSTGETKQSAFAALQAEAEALQSIWRSRITVALEQTKDLALAARMSQFLPPDRPAAVLDDAARSPSMQITAGHAQKRWGWLARQYRYAARDYPRPDFYAEAARIYGQLAPAPADDYIQVLQVAPVEPAGKIATEVNEGDPVLSVHWKVAGPTKKHGPVRVEVLTPAASWQVAQLNTPQSAEPLLLSVASDPAGDPRRQPVGFMLCFCLEDRCYHYRLDPRTLMPGAQVSILVTDQPTPTQDADAALDQITLRPSRTPQAYYLVAKNLTAKPRKCLAQVEGLPPALIDLAAGETKPIVLTAPPAKPKKPLPPLNSPVQLRIVDAETNELLGARSFWPSVLSPRNYVDASAVQFQPQSPAENRLQATLTSRLPVGSDPCAVILETPLASIPGLVSVKTGFFKGSLAGGQSLSLFAEDMQLLEGFSPQGEFQIHVDGVPRAFIYETTFARRGATVAPRRLVRPRIQLQAPTMLASSKSLPLSLLVDNAPDDATIEIALGSPTSNGLKAEITHSLKTPRELVLGFSAGGPAGAWLFSGGVQDWTPELNVEGIVGRRVVQVRLLDRHGAELAKDQQPILLDDTPPEDLFFVDLPESASNKAPIKLQAAGFDSLSDVAAVHFFVGKPVDDQPPAAATLIPAAKHGEQWRGELPAPKALGPVQVTAQFTNGVGLSSYVTATIDLNSNPPSIGGGVSGLITEGARPQANTPVWLLDKSGRVVATAQTAASGEFAFTDVKPGGYLVYTAKQATNRKASAQVTVKAKKQVVANLQLAL